MEKIPLISGKGDGKRRRLYKSFNKSYRSSSPSGSDSEEDSPVLPLKDPIESRIRRGTRNRNGQSNGTDVRLPINGGKGLKFPEENITYTWSGINVFASGKSEKKASSPWFRSFRKKGKSDYIPMSEPKISAKKHILQNVSGCANPGELLAIMGSSGAGKTTLLNVLTFRSSSSLLVSGLRAVNCIPINRSTLASLSAYVQQNDLFFGNLTVREHLIFQAMVRMDRNIPYHQRMLRVEDVLTELQLSSCQNTLIGVPGRVKGISGGEMKRLSFASEVLTNPPVMFCDEPTSGLDSFMAQTVVTVLKSMASKGKTIVCTIHQPSSEVYAMFDKILLMAEGRTAFLGSPKEAFTFFSSLGSVCPSNQNPADYYVELLAMVPLREAESRKNIRNICDTFEKSPYAERVSKHLEELEKYKMTAYENGWPENGDIANRSPYKASWLEQFRAVMWRSWLSMKKEAILIRVRMLQTIMVALILCLIFYGQRVSQDGVMNINGALFLCLTNMTFQNVVAVVQVFCSELPVFLREHLNGMYRTDVYFLSKMIAEIPVFLAIPVFFTCIVYYIVGFNPAPVHFLYALLIITLVSNAATSFGYLVSCASPSITVAMSVGPPLIIPFLLFGGFFLNIGSIPPYFRWLSSLSWFRYGTELLYINQWSDISTIPCDNTTASCYRDGAAVLDAYNFQPDHLAYNLVALALLIVFFRFLAFLALLSKTYRN